MYYKHVNLFEFKTRLKTGCHTYTTNKDNISLNSTRKTHNVSMSRR